MSKARLKKAILYHPDFCTRTGCVPFVRTPPCSVPDGLPPDEPVAFVIEDATVRWVGFPGATVRELITAFTQVVADTFAGCPTLHTYVLAFDKKCFVPVEKAATQKKRLAKLAASPLAWPYVAGPILHLDGPTPPWADLRRQPAAYRRAQAELCRYLEQYMCVPPGCRVVIDAESGLRVLEGDANGTRLPTYADPVFVNKIGEVDLSAQFYATYANAGAFCVPTRPATHAGRPTRARFPGGPIVIRTSRYLDTDYFALSMLHYRPLTNAGGVPCFAYKRLKGREPLEPPHYFPRPPHQLWLVAGFVDRTERPRRYDVFNVNQMIRAANHFVGSSALTMLGTINFLILTMLNGTDFIDPFPRLTPSALLAGLRAFHEHQPNYALADLYPERGLYVPKQRLREWIALSCVFGGALPKTARTCFTTLSGRALEDVRRHDTGATRVVPTDAEIDERHAALTFNLTYIFWAYKRPPLWADQLEPGDI